MTKRKSVPNSIQTEILLKSARRCCVCYGLKGDFEEKKGQIAHLDHDPSNYDPGNLTYLCFDHHDQYDSKTSQSKGLMVTEVKQYRSLLYEAVVQWRDAHLAQMEAYWPSNLEVPLLTESRLLNPVPNSIPTRGIQLIDKDPTGKDGYPLLYLSVYFKTSQFFGNIPPSKEKWLYLEAHMRPAFSLRIQVRAWSNRDIFEFIEFLRDPENEFMRGYDLHGPRPDNNEKHSGDSFLVWRENQENRLMLSTFTATNASMSIHARFSVDVANALVQYLEEVGFAKPLDT
jgi:hypothetical protein